MPVAINAGADETVIERKKQIVAALAAALDERDRNPPVRQDEKAELDDYLRDLVEQLSSLRSFLTYEDEAQKELDKEIDKMQRRIDTKPNAAAPAKRAQ